jgi:hypothetical protein
MNSKKNNQKSRLTKTNNKKSKNTQKIFSFQKEHEKVTKVSTVQELGGFPGSYHWRYSISATNAVFAIAANPASMFALNLNSPGNRAGYGWPTLSLVYDSYLVKSCHVFATVFNKSTTESYRFTIAPFNSEQATAYPTPTDDQWANNPFSATAVVGNSGSENVKTLSNSISIPRLAGLPKIDQSYDSYAAYTGSLNSLNVFSIPQESYKWNFSIQSLDGSTIPAATVYVTYNIIMDLIFFDKLPLGI